MDVEDDAHGAGAGARTGAVPRWARGASSSPGHGPVAGSPVPRWVAVIGAEGHDADLLEAVEHGLRGLPDHAGRAVPGSTAVAPAH